jgi:tetratricopeptide (TPR) repeat protein
MALRLCTGLWRFWQMRGYLAEGRERIERALALPHVEDHPDVLLAGLEAAGGIAYWMGDSDLATRRYEETLERARAKGDPASEANAHYNLVFPYAYRSEDGGDPDRARWHGERARELYRMIGDRYGEARAMWAISNTTWNDYFYALDYAVQALAIFREVGDSFMVGWASYTMALSSIQVEDLEGAKVPLLEALEIFSDADDVTGYVLVVDAVATIAARFGDREIAAQMSGAVAELERRTSTGLSTPNRRIIGWDPMTLRDDPETASAFAAGTRLSAHDAVALARAWLTRAAPDRSDDRPVSPAAAAEPMA